MKQLIPAQAVALQSIARNRHGAVLIKRGKLVSASTNIPIREPRINDTGRGCSIHAEAAAIRKAGNKAHGATLIVVRVNKSGKMLPSKPCKSCQGLISRSGIRKVYHS
jgi:tRNA(Arg) A34 adenosine deaminase TadA